MTSVVEGRAEEARWSIPGPLAGIAEALAPRKGWITRRPIDTIPAPELPITVTLTCDEITTLDPRTRQPDFATAEIVYRPGRRLIDSKSLHAYIVDLRPVGFSMERLATVLAADILAACRAAWVEVTVREKSRGGVAITAVCRIVEQKDAFDEWAGSH